MVQQGHNLSTAQVLLNAFGAGKVTEVRVQTTLLAHVTSLLFAELDLLTKESSRLEFSDESRQPIVAAFDRLSFSAMSQQWQQQIAIFQASIPALRIFGEGLPDEGPPIAADDLNSLSVSVRNLREEVEKSGMPEPVKRFLYQQLDIVEAAIRDYPIAGVNAFRTAAKDTLFQELEHPDEAKELEQTESASKFKLIIVRVREMSRVAFALGRLLAAGNSVVENAGKIAHSAGKVAHQVETAVQHLK